MKVALVAVPAVDEGREMTPSREGLRPVGADVIRPCPPYGVYLLAGVLAAAGHEARVIDLIADGRGVLDPAVIGVLDDVDLVGVSATSLAWAAARRTIAHVRAARPDVPIVAGGVHASLFDTHVLATSALDAVVRGDGEAPLVALCDALSAGGELGSVPSLTWRAPDGSVVRNADGAKISAPDITRWLPDYEQLPPRAYFGLALETSRGCTFSCTFCSTPHRRRWRGGEFNAVVDRLEHVSQYADRAITPTVYIVDDEFTLNPRRSMGIAAGLSRRAIATRLHYDSRAPDLLVPGLVDALAPHTASLLVGAECGYDEGLRRIGKGTTCAILDRAAAVLAAAGIARQADFSFIIGLPWETRTEVMRTVEFAHMLADRHGVRVLLNWYAQIPGSALWDEARRDGRIHESRYDEFGVQRDPNVFAGATMLTPEDVHAVANVVIASRKARRNGVPSAEFALPPSIAVDLR